MGWVERRDKTHHKARYRDAKGRERSKMFPTAEAANDWLAKQRVDLRRGDWIDPELAQITLGEWGSLWLDRKAARLKPSTIESYRSLLDTCVLPEWNTCGSALSLITTSTVGWLACRGVLARHGYARPTSCSRRCSMPP